MEGAPPRLDFQIVPRLDLIFPAAWGVLFALDVPTLTAFYAD